MNVLNIEYPIDQRALIVQGVAAPSRIRLPLDLTQYTPSERTVIAAWLDVATMRVQSPDGETPKLDNLKSASDYWRKIINKEM